MGDKTILFVCTGNTCRSYMAQAIAEHYLSALEDKGAGVRVLSAGTAAWDGAPPSPQALAVLAEQGIEASVHQSTCLTPELIREADLILAMTGGHRDSVLRLEPQAVGKVFLLKEFPPGQGKPDRPKEQSDIIDPFGMPTEFYRACAAELRERVAKALQAYLPGPESAAPEK